MTNLNIEKIIKRILALQLMNDRGWKEVDSKTDKLNKTEKLDSIRIFNKLKKWAIIENIVTNLSKNEYTLYIKDIGTLKEEESAELTWQIEKLVPLLWTLGIINELPEFSAPFKKEFYKELFFFKSDPIKQISTKYIKSANTLPRKLKEIELFSDAYMLYNWRCKELYLGSKKTNKYASGNTENIWSRNK